MSDFRKEFDLIMRAQFQGKDTLDGVIKSITGIESAIDKQSEAAKRGEVSLDQLKASSTKLVQAQEALKSFGKLFDNFNEAPAKVEAANAALERAKTKLAEYRASMSATGVPTDAQAAKLIALGEAVDRASTRYDNSKARLASLEAELRKAGVATDQLAASSERIKATMTSSVESYQRAQSAIQNYHNAQNRPGANLFVDNGRTTLSLLQRIRGEILSVTAAYVGLYGAINGANKSIEAYNEKQGILNMLTIQSGGDRQLAAKEYDYIRGQAERLGISLQEAAKGYAKFSAAATFAGRSVQENRYVFESVAEVGRVAQLGSEQMQRIFYAISQIDSKGRVMAEEFNQQLGDALPGLTGVAKQATAGIFTDFNKAMKEGKVSLDVFVDILSKYRELVSGQLPTAMETLQADQERFNNAIYEFKVLIAESGFADSFKALVNDLTVFFRSSDGKTFAKDIADAFSAVADILRFMLKHINEIILAAQILGTLFAAKIFLSIGMSIASAVKWLLELKTAISAVSFSFTSLGGAISAASLAFKALFGVFSAGMIGWDIGTYLYEQSTLVQKYSQLLIANLDLFFTRASGNLRAFWEVLKGNMAESRRIEAETEAKLAFIRQLKKDIAADEAKDTTQVSPTGVVTPKPENAKDDARRKLLEAIIAQLDKLEQDVRRKTPGAMNAIRDAYNNLLAQIKQLGGAESEEQLKRLEALHDKQIAAANVYAKHRLEVQKQIITDLEKADEEAGKKDLEVFGVRLQAKVDAIKTKWKPTFERIAQEQRDALAAGQSTELVDTQKKQLDADVARLTVLTKTKEGKDELKRIEKEMNEILDHRNKLIEAEVALEQAGSQSTDQTQANIARIRDEALQQYSELNTQAKEAIKNNADAFDPQDVIVYNAAIDKVYRNLQKLNNELVSAERVSHMVADGAAPVFETLGSSIWGVVNKTKSWGDAIRSVRDAFLNFVADFLRQIANMMIKQAIFNAMMKEGRNGGSGSGSSAGGIISSLISSMMSGGGDSTAPTGTNVGGTISYQAHTGAIVGMSGTSRPAFASWFENAPRYHNGGIPGMAPNEYATILKKNEEVLRDNDPRNILNGGAAANKSGGTSTVKIMNMIDSASVVSEGLSTQVGEQAILNVIRANRGSVKMLLGN